MLPAVHLCLCCIELGGLTEKAMALGTVLLLIPAAALCLGVNWAFLLTPLPFLAEEHLLFAQTPKRLLFLLWFILSFILLHFVRKRWNRN